MIYLLLFAAAAAAAVLVYDDPVLGRMRDLTIEADEALARLIDWALRPLAPPLFRVSWPALKLLQERRSPAPKSQLATVQRRGAVRFMQVQVQLV